tara:strand:- start:281 stop:496 length:216 start_codon:yes stop_codon:yes gene_type:complete
MHKAKRINTGSYLYRGFYIWAENDWKDTWLIQQSIDLYDIDEIDAYFSHTFRDAKNDVDNFLDRGIKLEHI